MTPRPLDSAWAFRDLLATVKQPSFKKASRKRWIAPFVSSVSVEPKIAAHLLDTTIHTKVAPMVELYRRLCWQRLWIQLFTLTNSINSAKTRREKKSRISCVTLRILPRIPYLKTNISRVSLSIYPELCLYSHSMMNPKSIPSWKIGFIWFAQKVLLQNRRFRSFATILFQKCVAKSHPYL